MQHLPVATLLCLSVAAQSPTPADPVDVPTWTGSTVATWESTASTAAELLESGLDGRVELRQAVDSAIESLGTARTADRLRELLRGEMADDALAAALERVVSDLRFEPTLEAELPVGFPSTAPVGEVVLKSYPAYRMARTGMSARGGMSTSFWRLFQHIKQHEIAMTAPVQIDYAEASAERTESMAFLYGDPQLGDAGTERQVEVVDVEPVLAISIGGRFYENREQIAALHQVLQDWLVAHGDTFEVAGPMRTMGYNSPMVPASKRFWEVEIPVRPRAPNEVSSAACTPASN